MQIINHTTTTATSGTTTPTPATSGTTTPATPPLTSINPDGGLVLAQQEVQPLTITSPASLMEHRPYLNTLERVDSVGTNARETHSTLYMAVILTAFERSIIGNEFDDHPYQSATNHLMHSNTIFSTFVNRLIFRINNNIINSNNNQFTFSYQNSNGELLEVGIRSIIDVNNLSDAPYHLPDNIQEGLIEYVQMTDELLNLYNSETNIENTIDALIQHPDDSIFVGGPPANREQPSEDTTTTPTTTTPTTTTPTTTTPAPLQTKPTVIQGG